MRLLIQHIKSATITINNDIKRSIGAGIIVYVGINKQSLPIDDTRIQKATTRMLNLTLFKNEAGKMKESLQSINGEILLVSNFTLHARNKKGNQLDFGDAAGFDDARHVYDTLVDTLRSHYDPDKIQTGEFGAYMQIDSIVDGPVNVIIDI